jgi:two-component sensor histidine kinase
MDQRQEIELPAATAIPLGFIANELITNAAKYGTGRIMVRLEPNPEKGYAPLSVRTSATKSGFRSSLLSIVKFEWPLSFAALLDDFVPEKSSTGLSLIDRCLRFGRHRIRPSNPARNRELWSAARCDEAQRGAVQKQNYFQKK